MVTAKDLLDLLVNYVAPMVRYGSSWNGNRAEFDQDNGWRFSLEITTADVAPAIEPPDTTAHAAVVAVRDELYDFLNGIAEPGDRIVVTNVGSAPAVAVREAASATWFVAPVGLVHAGQGSYNVNRSGNRQAREFQGMVNAAARVQLDEAEAFERLREDPTGQVPQILVERLVDSLQPPTQQELAEYAQDVYHDHPTDAARFDLWKDHDRYDLRIVAVLDSGFGDTHFTTIDAVVFTTGNGRILLAVPAKGGNERDGANGPVLNGLDVTDLVAVTNEAEFRVALRPYTDRFTGRPEDQRLLELQVQEALRMARLA